MNNIDSSEISWLSEMGLDNSFFTDQCDFMDDEIAAVLDMNSSSSSTLINTIPSTNSISSLYTDHHHPYSPNYTNNTNTNTNTNTNNNNSNKVQKPNDFSQFSTAGSDRSSAPIILNFENAAEKGGGPGEGLNPEEEAAVSEVLMRCEPGGGGIRDRDQMRQPPPPAAAAATRKASRVRPASQTYDHIIAERKRREQLSQRFMVLSTIVPGLKKMDKTSVLGDAIKYLKQLQERVKTLEEQASRQTMEAVVLVKKSQVVAEDEGSSDEISGSSDEMPLPEIEARVCSNHILLRVHCEKHKGVLVNLLSEIETLNMAVTNTNVTPFGNLALDITIVAEMEKEFNLSVKDVVKRLRAAL